MQTIFKTGLILLFTGVVLSFTSLPAFPDSLVNSVHTWFDLMFENATILGIFIRPVTFQIAFPLVIAIISLDKILKLSLWIYDKLRG